ncbi:MAG: DUF2817 domain-containing protein [Spirochaetia bacterium]|nr:DUF2817 domain-containing protein [Spirochaetia bacterium]
MSTKEILKESIPFKNPKEAVFTGNGWFVVGQSAGKKDIMAKKLEAEKSKRKVLLIGGVHGNETEGVRFMVDFCKEFAKDEQKSPFDFGLYLLPLLNPDGFFKYERKNAAGIDLNRNMSTKDWAEEYTEEKYNPGKYPGSEPESQILEQVVNMYKPNYIISFHSWKPLININGPAEPFAEKMKNKLKMKIVKDIGYPTPGSLGTYAGWERNIPTITLEFERGMKLEEVYRYAKEGVLDSFTVL